MHYSKTKGEKTFDVFNIILMLVVAFITLYPFWYTLSGSLSSSSDYVKGYSYFWPRKITLENYKAVFRDAEILRSYGITASRTLLGTIAHLLFTGIFAYGLSRKNLIGRKFYTTMGLITMYFGGGLIPYYLVIKQLGLINKFAVYIIIHMFSFFNVLIFMSFFRGIQEEINESAKIDGAGEYKIFFWLIVPLSKPVIATIALFSGVGHWNAFFDSMMYTTKASLQTIQVYMMKLIISTDAASKAAAIQGIYVHEEDIISSQTVQLATMIVTVAPILILYPFLQKYFVKGIMIGSVKG